jgi:hypothetical protein
MGAFSRRRLLAHGGAALAFAPALARAAALPPATTSAPAIPPKPSAEAIQAFLDATRRMTLDVSIDDKGPFRFMVDTGADQSVISTEVAQQLGLIHGDDVTVQGISRAVTAPTVQLNDVRFGYVAIDSLMAPVLPRAWLGADGYLGLDVVDGRKVTFDFEHEQIKVDVSDHPADWVHSSDVIVRVNGSNGRLKAVNCSVDGVHAYAFIDSGAEMSIGNSHLFAALQEKGASYISDAAVPIVGVTGGMSPGRFTSVKDIKLGSLSFLHSNLVIADLQVFDVWGLNDRPALFIGMNFLRQTSALTIDFGLKEFRFRLASIRLASRA